MEILCLMVTMLFCRWKKIACKKLFRVSTSARTMGIEDLQLLYCPQTHWNISRSTNPGRMAKTCHANVRMLHVYGCMKLTECREIQKYIDHIRKLSGEVLFATPLQTNLWILKMNAAWKRSFVMICHQEIIVFQWLNFKRAYILRSWLCVYRKAKKSQKMGCPSHWHIPMFQHPGCGSN